MISVFPKPTGKYTVGYFDSVLSYDYENSKRTIGYRCFYPSNSTGKKPTKYFIDFEMAEMFRKASAEFASDEKLKFVFELSELDTNCFENVNAAVSEDKFKLVVYSPAYGAHAWSNLIIVEELVSRGYVVLAVSPTGESFCTILGDKKIPADNEITDKFRTDVGKYMTDTKNGPLSEWTPEMLSDFLEKCAYPASRIKIWTRDVIELVNKISQENENPESLLFGKIDCSEYGIFGHSFGGATAFNTTIFDKRCIAAINIDGWQFGANLTKRKLAVPGMIILSDDNFFEGNYGKNNEEIMRLLIPEATHNFFCDACVLFPDFIRGLENTKIDGNILMDIMKDFVTAFFEKTLMKRKDVDFSELKNNYKEYAKVKNAF